MMPLISSSMEAITKSFRTGALIYMGIVSICPPGKNTKRPSALAACVFWRRFFLPPYTTCIVLVTTALLAQFLWPHFVLHD
jgi:hypothetical protein